MTRRAVQRPSMSTWRAFSFACIALFVVAASGCFDSVGLACPPGDPTCEGTPPDLEATVAPDLSLLDLAPTLSVDLADCAAGCPKGCCDRLGCHLPSTETCGLKGATCHSCDPATSDRCGAAGCVCGTASPCAVGTRCVAGRCQCDPTSCTQGCCDLMGACHALGAATCSGVAAGACVICEPTRTDGCLSGCTCGNNPPCQVGQRCAGGVCVCDAKSCLLGCCLGEACHSPSVMTCGVAGSACAPCDPLQSDNCASGACSCGNGPPCMPGSRCASGACVCDAMSCPNGCCTGNQCMAASLVTCGIKGAACVGCQRSDACTNGACLCGANGPCALGQACVNGRCVCNALSCPGGCCKGDTCQPGTDAGACGVKGAACSSCAAGQACDLGVCICNANSCAKSCCTNGLCAVPGLMFCALGGLACKACDARSDQCLAGLCVCGNLGKACASGQVCLNGACVCNANSCPACCVNNACVPPTDAGICQ